MIERLVVFGGTGDLMGRYLLPTGQAPLSPVNAGGLFEARWSRSA